MGASERRVASSAVVDLGPFADPAHYNGINDVDFRDYLIEFAGACLIPDSPNHITTQRASARINDYLQGEITKTRAFVNSCMDLGVVAISRQENGKGTSIGFKNKGLMALGILLWFDPIDNPFRSDEIPQLMQEIQELIGDHPVRDGFPLLQTRTVPKRSRYTSDNKQNGSKDSREVTAGLVEPASALSEAFPIIEEPNTPLKLKIAPRNQVIGAAADSSSFRYEYGNTNATFDPQVLRSSSLAGELRRRRKLEARIAHYKKVGIPTDDLCLS
jgi:hypothetical protein